MRTTKSKRTAPLAAIALLVAVAAWAEAPESETNEADKTATITTAPKPQTVCPVGGNPIDKKVSVTYGGQKIYFCCPGCDTDFLVDPDQYLGKIK